MHGYEGGVWGRGEPARVQGSLLAYPEKQPHNHLLTIVLILNIKIY